MEFKDAAFSIEFTEECIEEMTEIYIYISKNLNQINSAKQIILMVYERVSNLTKNPELYMKIGKVDKLKREYHRIVIKNFVVLYTIDYDNKKVYISRMIYGRRNYLC